MAVELETFCRFIVINCFGNEAAGLRPSTNHMAMTNRTNANLNMVH